MIRGGRGYPVRFRAVVLRGETAGFPHMDVEDVAAEKLAALSKGDSE